MQSLLESLNYYGFFIEDFAIDAAVQYELRKAECHEIRCAQNRSNQLEVLNQPGLKDGFRETEGGRYGDKDKDRLEKATIAFAILKTKIATTPILRHFDPDRLPVIVVYASKWAISATKMSRIQWIPGYYHRAPRLFMSVLRVHPAG